MPILFPFIPSVVYLCIGHGADTKIVCLVLHGVGHHFQALASTLATLSDISTKLVSLAGYMKFGVYSNSAPIMWFCQLRNFVVVHTRTQSLASTMRYHIMRAPRANEVAMNILEGCYCPGIHPIDAGADPSLSRHID